MKGGGSLTEAQERDHAPSGVSTVLIVDDHPIVRRGLAQVIEAEKDLAVCGEAADPDEALEIAREQQPHVAVVDIGLARGDGLELVRELRTHLPAVKALVLSLHDEAVYAERALRAGARGYIMKEAGGDEVVEAIRRVLSGDFYLSERMNARFLNRFASGGPAAGAKPVDALTDRELQVFRLIGRGRGTRDIAKELDLSVKTIETYRERIKRKLGLRNAVELVQRAVLWLRDA